MSEHTKSNLTVSGDYLMGRCVGGCQLKEGEFMVAQVRGWGYLQYLGEEKAMAIQKANAERLALCWNSYESDQKLIKDLVKAGKQAIGVINALPKNNYIHESGSAITNLYTAIAAAEKRSEK